MGYFNKKRETKEQTLKETGNPVNIKEGENSNRHFKNQHKAAQ